MTKKLNRVDDLLFYAISELSQIAEMAKDLERQHRTKAVCAEICIIAENGEIVYRIWNTEGTKKLLPGLEETLITNGVIPPPDFLDFLGRNIPFGFIAKWTGMRGQE